MGKRRIFRDRQGRFTKPDRRKIFRMEIDGERTELMSWTERQLAEALAIPLEPEDEPRFQFLSRRYVCHDETSRPLRQVLRETWRRDRN